MKHTYVKVNLKLEYQSLQSHLWYQPLSFAHLSVTIGQTMKLAVAYFKMEQNALAVTASNLLVKKCSHPNIKTSLGDALNNS